MGATRTSTGSVGRYELLFELARGGMAELFLGRLRGVGGFERLVAIKRILPHLAEDRLFAEMFLQEGRIAARLAHPAICQVHELGEADGELFLAMEYLEGAPWSELVRVLPRDAASATSTLRLAAGVIAQACEGLHHAHELRDHDGNPTPVVHRDVSPQNLFVTSDGACKVLDFGIAKMVSEGPRTRTGVLKGKLPYMSPEQIQGEPLDARTDVFALGVVLWESLTGTALFDRETDFLIWKAITEAPVPPLAPRGYPPAIDAVIASALARDKDQRFRSARALGEALRTAVEPLGGALDASEIAAVVHRTCGDALAVRRQQIAMAVTATPAEPDAADTLEDRAGSTVRLRSDAKAVQRDAPVSEETLPPALPHRSKAPWIVAGGLVVAAGIVALAILRAPASSAPASSAPASSAPASSAPSSEPVVAVDAAVAGDPDLARAREALEMVRTLGQDSDGGLERTMKAVGRLSKLGQGMEAVRDEQGALSIASQPMAVIFIDGKRLGATPYVDYPLAPGTYELRAVLEDGRTQQQTLEIEAGVTTDLGTLAW